MKFMMHGFTTINFIQIFGKTQKLRTKKKEKKSFLSNEIDSGCVALKRNKISFEKSKYSRFKFVPAIMHSVDHELHRFFY